MFHSILIIIAVETSYVVAAIFIITIINRIFNTQIVVRIAFMRHEMIV